jgi:hypothetical protein
MLRLVIGIFIIAFATGMDNDTSMLAISTLIGVGMAVMLWGLDNVERSWF